MRVTLLLSLLLVSCSAAVAGTRPVALEVEGGTLHGTELTPDGVAGKVPVVLLHPGSGPTDRDGNVRGLPGPNDALRQLAEGLARQGIASVRYDKRLIGASTAPGWKEESLRFDDYISDVQAWSKRLRGDPRFSRLVLAGHSEGALIVTAACNASGADACASIAGIGRNFADVLNDQLKPKLPAPLQMQNERILGLLHQGKTVADMPPELLFLYRPAIQPYLISVIRRDPATIAAGIAVPLLIVQGTADIQVGVKDAQALSAAAPGARLLIVDGMNHVLKLVGGDATLQQKSYVSPDLPVAQQLVDAVAALAAGDQ